MNGETYWFVCWRCSCNALTLQLSDIPARCPEHAREFIEPPERVTVADGFVPVLGILTDAQTRGGE